MICSTPGMSAQHSGWTSSISPNTPSAHVEQMRSHIPAQTFRVVHLCKQWQMHWRTADTDTPNLVANFQVSLQYTETHTQAHMLLAFIVTHINTQGLIIFPQQSWEVCQCFFKTPLGGCVPSKMHINKKTSHLPDFFTISHFIIWTNVPSLLFYHHCLFFIKKTIVLSLISSFNSSLVSIFDLNGHEPMKCVNQSSLVSFRLHVVTGLFETFTLTNNLAFN